MKRSSELKRKTPIRSASEPGRKPMRRHQKKAKDCRWRSEAYLKFVRTLPCAMCGTTQGIVAHHCKGIWHLSGTGLKAPDSMTMPLCDGPGDTCHRKVHNEAVYRDQQPDYLRRTIRAALTEFTGSTAFELVNALAFLEAQEERS